VAGVLHVKTSLNIGVKMATLPDQKIQTEFEVYVRENYPKIYSSYVAGEILAPNETWLLGIAHRAFVNAFLRGYKQALEDQKNDQATQGNVSSNPAD
jgi:hypothetical protein